MLKFIIRRLLLLILTMFLVSVVVFLITESSPGNVARNVLGSFVTPEQEASFLAQMGLDKPSWLRYIYWLIGSDWHGARKVGMELRKITTDQDFEEWWAVKPEGTLIRWKLEGEDLYAQERTAEGEITEYLDNGRWQTNEEGVSTFWGVDAQNHVVQWEKRVGSQSVDLCGWDRMDGNHWRAKGIYSAQERIFTRRSGRFTAHRATGLQESVRAFSEFGGAGPDRVCHRHAIGLNSGRHCRTARRLLARPAFSRFPA